MDARRRMSVRRGRDQAGQAARRQRNNLGSGSWDCPPLKLKESGKTHRHCTKRTAAASFVLEDKKENSPKVHQ